MRAREEAPPAGDGQPPAPGPRRAAQYRDRSTEDQRSRLDLAQYRDRSTEDQRSRLDLAHGWTSRGSVARGRSATRSGGHSSCHHRARVGAAQHVAKRKTLRLHFCARLRPRSGPLSDEGPGCRSCRTTVCTGPANLLGGVSRLAGRRHDQHHLHRLARHAAGHRPPPRHRLSVRQVDEPVANTRPHRPLTTPRQRSSATGCRCSSAHGTCGGLTIQRKIRASCAGQFRAGAAGTA